MQFQRKRQFADIQPKRRRRPYSAYPGLESQTISPDLSEKDIPQRLPSQTKSQQEYREYLAQRPDYDFRMRERYDENLHEGPYFTQRSGEGMTLSPEERYDLDQHSAQEYGHMSRAEGYGDLQPRDYQEADHYYDRQEDFSGDPRRYLPRNEFAPRSETEHAPSPHQPYQQEPFASDRVNESTPGPQNFYQERQTPHQRPLQGYSVRHPGAEYVRDASSLGREMPIQEEKPLQSASRRYGGEPKSTGENPGSMRPEVIQFGRKMAGEEVPLMQQASEYIPKNTLAQKLHGSVWNEGDTKTLIKRNLNTLPKKNRFKWKFFAFPKFLVSFAMVSMLILVVVGGFSFVSSGIDMKGEVLGVSYDAYDSLQEAALHIQDKDFQASAMSLDESHAYFTKAVEDIDNWAGIFGKSDITLPPFSYLTSGKNAAELGQNLTASGKEFHIIIDLLTKIQFPEDKDEFSILEAYKDISTHFEKAQEHIALAQSNADKIQISHIPEEQRDTFLLLQKLLPEVSKNLDMFLANSEAFIDTLGGNGPRKYLFLLQNNHELRATGGFIGSYGYLDIDSGKVRKFFVDGIFNPDGQLNIDIVPPKPIQKISAGWSLHDSNWFPDFPLSAEKAISFYEKTGGATVDGVITFTPTVMERLLEITGPIYLEEYDKTINSENFVREIQQEVEVDYDKEENNPKKILADITPLLFERLSQLDDYELLLEVFKSLETSLEEKHILLYSQNPDLQNLYSELGWSGEMRNSLHDYLSVVHSNINGYKTDGVTDDSIQHEVQIQIDGTIIDTVSITRKHNGGDTDYEWWNKVNANFMRVYVPLGSELISAEGYTREFNDDPLDYEKLGFHRDGDVVFIEENAEIDPDTGTRIFEESGKTVFGNWVYVSPQESVTVTYTYKLPFKIDVQNLHESVDSYSLLVQKQSGTEEVDFSSQVYVPNGWKIQWKYPDALHVSPESIDYSEDLRKDRFFGFILKK